MDLTRVRLSTSFASVDLPFDAFSGTDQFLLKVADGLDPVESGVLIAPTLRAGGVHRGRRTPLREVILRVGLKPRYYNGQTPGDLRKMLYGLLSAGDAGDSDVVLVELFNRGQSSLWGYTRGYVKRIEAVPFSKEAEVIITISCLTSYLQQPKYSPPLASIGTAMPTIDNPGTAPTGFYAELTFTRAVSAWVLQTGGTRNMWFQNGFAIGDKLKINTNPGLRRVVRVRDGDQDDLLAALTNASVWHMLRPGTNVFTTSSPDFVWDRFELFPMHWGI